MTQLATKIRNRRLIINADFETAVGAVAEAVRTEGLQVVSRVDLRDHFWRNTGRDCRRYVLIEAWSPELALDALQQDPDLGPILPAVFAIYELTGRETVVEVKEPLSPAADDTQWRTEVPRLAAMADRARAQVARTFDRLQHRDCP